MSQAKEVLQSTGYSLPYECMQRLKEQGKLVLIGQRYYLSGTVVPPEQHYEVICAHLKEKGSAGLGELAELLGIEYKQCLWILQGMVKEGKLLHEARQYSLAREG